MVLYNAVLALALGCVAAAWVTALVMGVSAWGPQGDRVIALWLNRAIACSLAGIAFHGLFYVWWVWQLARLARRLGDTRQHQHALDELLSMGKHAVTPLIRTLSVPGVQWRGKKGVVWDADIARRLAAEGLGRLKDSAAVQALVEVLTDQDVGLCARAARALGEIGDCGAVEALVPLLGDERAVSDEREGHRDETLRVAITRTLEGVGGRPVGDVAAQALDELGEGKLAQAFQAALAGETGALKELATVRRREIVGGLTRLLDSHRAAAAARAAEILAELDGVEALPELRSKASVFSRVDGEVKEACREAISRLETRAGLPRAAQTPAPSVETLLRPAGEPEPEIDTLPRAPEGETETPARRPPQGTQQVGDAR
jgi:hypothetical protein